MATAMMAAFCVFITLALISLLLGVRCFLRFLDAPVDVAYRETQRLNASVYGFISSASFSLAAAFWLLWLGMA